MTYELKKPYTLDYSIERDIDRMHAVEDILDKLERNPSSTELEQMGSYILYGKDENGKNAYQRGEMVKQTRYNSFVTKDEKTLSLDALLENPLSDQQELRELGTRDPRIQSKSIIVRPKYNKKTGELLDIGDADIPGMEELWHCIDKLEHWIAVLEGKVPPQPTDMLFDNPYRLYRLKHTLIDLRRHQYYLKDAYKPTIHFLAVDHPKRQYIDWNSDSFYWIPYSTWQNRVQSSYYPVSQNIADYETRENSKSEEIEVKWVVRRHIFNWEDPAHIYAFICNYQALENLLWDKLDTDGHALLMDFQRYRRMANLSPARECILDCKINQFTYDEIRATIQREHNISYCNSRMANILIREIPRAIAEAATRHRLLTTTPLRGCKPCKTCGRVLPKHPLFFAIHNDRHDHFSQHCKDCERAARIAKGGQHTHDRRNKEATLLEMQTRKT